MDLRSRSRYDLAARTTDVVMQCYIKEMNCQGSLGTSFSCRLLHRLDWHIIPARLTNDFYKANVRSACSFCNSLALTSFVSPTKSSLFFPAAAHDQHGRPFDCQRSYDTVHRLDESEFCQWVNGIHGSTWIPIDDRSNGSDSNCSSLPRDCTRDDARKRSNEVNKIGRAHV